MNQTGSANITITPHKRTMPSVTNVAAAAISRTISMHKDIGQCGQYFSNSGGIQKNGGGSVGGCHSSIWGITGEQEWHIDIKTGSRIFLIALYYLYVKIRKYSVFFSLLIIAIQNIVLIKYKDLIILKLHIRDFQSFNNI